MRILTYTLFSLSLFLFSCDQEKKEQRPTYLIDEDKMVSIMVDMHIVETASNLKIYPPDSAQQMYFDDFESVYLTHEITKEKFDSSLYYYATQTDQMNIIYDRILENLSEMESEVNSDK